MAEKEIREYYDKEYYKNISKVDFAEYERNSYFYRHFLRYLPQDTRKTLLDVGCGGGQLLYLVEKDNVQTLGADISLAAISTAKRYCTKSSFFLMQGETLAFKNNTFDYVTCLGSLEHFKNIERGVKEIKRVMKDEGKAIILVPNINYFAWFFSSVKGTGQAKVSETLHSLSEWGSVFERNGLEIEGICRDYRFLDQVINDPSIPSLKKLIFKMLFNLLPLKFTYQFLFILIKRGSKALRQCS